MNVDSQANERKKLLWPGAAIAIGVLVSVNPFFEPHIPLDIGIAAWFVETALVVLFSWHPVTTRLGILMTGPFFAIPCYLQALPLSRGLLMCGMGFPFAIASSSLFAPPSANFRERQAFLFTWCGTQTIRRRPKSFEAMPLFWLVVAALIFAAALAGLRSFPDVGAWRPARWLAGGVMIFAFAEMATASHDFLTTMMGLRSPALMRSPVLSTSINEFWTTRWNVITSRLGFRPLVFERLAPHGLVLALFATFFVSGVLHMLIAYVAMVRWKISLVCGLFFFVQPVLILCERTMRVRRWPTAAARLWTLSALAVTSPLFVEPVLQMIGPNLDRMTGVLSPTLFFLCFATTLNLFFAVGQWWSCRDMTVSGSAIETGTTTA